MEKIYSKILPEKLLHIIFHKKDFVEGRIDLIDAEEFLQCAALKFNKGKTFKPHKHIHNLKILNMIAQESWIVIQGSVRCTLYDLNNKIIAKPILYAGDASFTLNGGHTYTILEDNTILYEYKTGPYEGQEYDKVFIK